MADATGEAAGGADDGAPGATIVSEMLVPFCACLLLLGLATAAERTLKRAGTAHPCHRHLRAVRIAQCVLSWYLVSVSFTLWNKFVLRYWRGTGFPFPVFVTLLHMTTKLGITRLLNLPCATAPDKRIRGLPCREAVRGPVPIGVCTAMDVAFSNLSFLFISVTFYTILKASAVLWILAWASLLGLETLTWEVLSICGLVSTGVALASYGEAAFNWSGFFLVTAACALSGLRWALTQTMLEGKADVGGGGHGGSNMGSSMSNGGGSRGQHRQLPSLSASVSSSGLRGGDDGGGGDGLTASNGHGRATGAAAAAAAAAGAIGHEELEEVEVELPDPLASGTRAPPSQHYRPPPRAATATAGVASPDSPPRPPPSRARRSSSSHSQHHRGAHHQHRPLEILYHISPSSALACLPVFLLFEARAMWASPFLATPFLASEVLLMLTLGGAFSFLLILAEVQLVKISSSLTMSMFGAVKEVITVALSMLAFHDAVSPLNVAGLVLAIGGAVWYRSYKLRSAAEGGRSGSADGGWAPAEYLPAASGIFHLDEDEESEGEEEEDGRGSGRRQGRGGLDGYREQELRAVGRGQDVGLA